MKNNLTPEQRVNKNGHVVTKHVKAQPTSATSTAGFPAPASQPVSTVYRASRITNMVHQMDIGTLYGDSGDLAVEEALTGFSDSTIDIIEKAVAFNTEHGNQRRKFMYSVITEADERTVRETMFHRPHYPIDVDTSEAIGITKGLHQLERFKGHAHLEELTGEDLDTAIAFISVTSFLVSPFSGGHVVYEYVDDDQDESVYIADKEMHDLIVQHYDKADDMTIFMASRDSSDPAALREYLENYTALAEGSL